MDTKARLAASALALSIFAVGSANAITVDNSLADWGVILRDKTVDSSCGNTASACHPSDFTGAGTGAGLVGHTFSQIDRHGNIAREDTNDRSNGYNVGPNGGGQDFDVEWMGAAYIHVGSATKIYIAIAHGQRPDNGTSLFEPGDIMIKTGTKVFGIEVGGSTPADNTAISATSGAGAPAGTTYKLNSNGTVQSVVHLPGQVAGSIWETTLAAPAGPTFGAGQFGGSWLYDPISGGSPCDPADPATLLNGEGFCGKQPTQFDKDKGTAAFKGHAEAYSYTRGATPSLDADNADAPMTSTQHSIIGLVFDAATILGPGYDAGEGFDLDFIFMTACGNDALTVNLQEPREFIETPAPGALALFGIGLGLLGWARRRRG